MSLLRQRWPSMVALLLLLLALIWLRSVVLTFIVQPIAWLLWAAWRLLASVDETILWTILILVCAGIALRAIPFGPGPQDEDAFPVPPSSSAGDRYAHWRALVDSARGHEGRSTLLLLLRQLAANVADVARRSPPSGMSSSNRGLIAWLSRLVPAYRRRRDWNEIESLLVWMESTLEIEHERSAD